jgi:hypothetical protein
MLAKQFLLDEPDASLVHDAADYLAGYAEESWADPSRRQQSDFYAWYNCSLGMFQAGGEPWNRWNKVIRDELIRLQRHDGCARGSWDPKCQWGSEGGRVFATALGALTLEVYYRYVGHNEPRGAVPPAVTVTPGVEAIEPGATGRPVELNVPDRPAEIHVPESSDQPHKQKDAAK